MWKFISSNQDFTSSRSIRLICRHSRVDPSLGLNNTSLDSPTCGGFLREFRDFPIVNKPSLRPLHYSQLESA